MNDTITTASRDYTTLFNYCLYALVAFLAIEFIRWLMKRNRPASTITPEDPPLAPPTDIPWESRFQEADTTIRELIATLPPKIRAEADRVPFILEKWPPDDAAPDTLGHYLAFEESVVASAPGPIMIYIGPHHEFCLEENIDFVEEIRRTYLHELGHHLGLEESDLDDRGIG